MIQEGFVSFVNKSQLYIDLLNICIDSVLEFTDKKIEVFSIGFKYSHPSNSDRIIVRTIGARNNFGDLCYEKLFAAANCSFDKAIMLDADMIVTPDVVNLFDKIDLNAKYPLGSLHPTDPNNQWSIMDVLNVKRKTQPYVHATFLFNKNCADFFNMCYEFSQEARKKGYKIPNFDETILNVMLWKAKQTESYVDTYDPYYAVFLDRSTESKKRNGYHNLKSLDSYVCHGCKDINKSIEIFNLIKFPKTKKRISFSLYGNKPNFQVGAVLNVLEAKRLYPEWKCRFYTTDDDTICKQLEYLGAEVVKMDDWPNGQMFWRFLAIDDSDVCISRDADSVVNERELGAVNEWLSTEKQWHLMHDHRNHRKSMMGGMWGFKKGHLIKFGKKTIRQCIQEWLELGNTSEGYGHDQEFLAQVIYPMTSENALKHGNFGKPFPVHTPCRYGRFVGDYSFWINGWKGFVDGDKKSLNERESDHSKKFERILDRVIIACDSNKDYLDFWPLASAAWQKIGVKPTLVLIEGSDESVKVDESLGDIVRIKLPNDSVHSAFAAQTVRLLAPALYPDENITIADIDIIPLSKEYFFENIKRGSQDSFIEFRSGSDNRVASDQIPICWNIAKGSIWSEIFKVNANFENYQDVFVNRLKEWYPASYRPIQEGKSIYWFTDQKLLFDHLSNWDGTRVRLVDSETGYCRLDHRVKKVAGMHDHFTDFCPRRPPKYSLAHVGRPDLDNIDTIKHVFDWYKIPWKYKEINVMNNYKTDESEDKFTHIFNTRGFGKSRSASGPGSDDRQTQVLKKELKNLIKEYNIKSMLDCPCGDFYWMKDIINDEVLSDMTYIGGDIVSEIIDSNKATHGSLLNNKSRFVRFDILEDTIPDVDLLFCRDLLVHFSISLIDQVLKRIKNSNVKYVLTTTFMNRKNVDCAMGGWRHLCLFSPPFSLPPPLKIVSEVCTESWPNAIDKSLGLWLREDLR